jgi:hypothetical protein
LDERLRQHPGISIARGAELDGAYFKELLISKSY